jgi:predicted transcriptional regulator
MAKMSENSVKLLTYLQENAGTKMTADEVAANTGIAKATITGAFTAFVKKGLGVREEAQVPGNVEVSFLTVTDEGKAVDTAEMSENAQAIIAHLIATNNAPATLDDVAAALNIDKKKVNGAFNALVRKGYCARVAATIEAPVTVKYLVLTDAGMSFDPSADAE